MTLLLLLTICTSERALSLRMISAILLIRLTMSRDPDETLIKSDLRVHSDFICVERNRCKNRVYFSDEPAYRCRSSLTFIHGLARLTTAQTVGKSDTN